MAAKPAWITGWTGQHVRHAATMIRLGGNPAARVYESIGADFFLAVVPGWLNLGLWEGPGSEDEAEDACRRLVRTVASELPASGVVVDVGNGLGTQDPLIAETVGPRRLVAVNITEWQLAAGRDRLREAAAAPVVGDAARLPIADGTVDGVISVEAAFHFRSRRAFFDECYRVLRPGGVLSTSDISVQRWPIGPAELLAGLTQLRVFGLRPSMAMTAAQIAAAARGRLGRGDGHRVRRPRHRSLGSPHRRPAGQAHGGTSRPAGRRPAAAVAGRPAVAPPDHRLPAAAGGPAVASMGRLRPGSGQALGEGDADRFGHCGSSDVSRVPTAELSPASAVATPFTVLALKWADMSETAFSTLSSAAFTALVWACIWPCALAVRALSCALTSATSDLISSAVPFPIRTWRSLSTEACRAAASWHTADAGLAGGDVAAAGVGLWLGDAPPPGDEVVLEPQAAHSSPPATATPMMRHR